MPYIVPRRILRENMELFAGDPFHFRTINNWAMDYVEDPLLADWGYLIGVTASFGYDRVTHVGMYRTATRSGKEKIVPFIIRQNPKQTDPEKLVGTAHDASGDANVEGIILPDRVEFRKTYRSKGVNPKPILYVGEAVGKDVYIGTWRFEAGIDAEMASSGVFKMRTIESAKTSLTSKLTGLSSIEIESNDKIDVRNFMKSHPKT